MAPQKFGSVRHRGRPTASARLAPFRDDTGLVALRYEETKQAEPPIPLPPPRNPRRLARTQSTFTSSTAPTFPITVNPPPQEVHPLFRAQRPSPPSRTEEWKRDSGAPTSSSITLREEDAEDPVHQKILDDIADTPSVYSDDEEEIVNAPQSTLVSQFTPPPLTVSIPPRPENLESIVSSPTQSVPSPTRRTSFTTKIGKSFGVGSDGSKRLRKKNLGADRAAAQAAPPEMDPLRGSPRSPKSPKLPPQATGPGVPGPSSADKEDPQTPFRSATTNDKSFAPINTPIPDDSLWEDFGALSFSKRGSIMFGGKNSLFKSLMMSTPDAKSNAPPADDQRRHATTTTASAATELQTPTTATDDNNNGSVGKTDVTGAATENPRAPPPADAPSVPSIRVSSMDVERESQKVRSLYESGDDLNWEDGGRVSYPDRLEPTAEVPFEEEENVVSSRLSDPPSAPGLHQGDGQLNPTPTPPTTTPRSANSLSPLRDSQVRREYERAGGIEDWADLDGAEVDRYGFISPKRPVSRAESSQLRSSPFSTRRRNVLTKRPSTSYSTSLPGGFIRPPSRKVSARSLNTYSSDLSNISRRSTRSSIRSATNRLPHNRDRRWMDEASEMLSLQAGLTGITDEEKMGKTLEASKRKEAERSEKWRKMATAVKTGIASSSKDNNAPDPGLESQPSGGPQGQGMSYTFDTASPKLIDRTWKGIPDCWRSAAWYAFLATSAAAHNYNHVHNRTPRETEDYLIAEFRRLQAVASPDDVQIDLDVPRTVNGHIMFRRRYRGGQRLLFRVLHAISLHFPDTGYVQGMASLAATLLCYFDEERAFVMLVRLWRYRGLERLYEPGFEGLMGALKELEERWLTGAGKDVASKLAELDISATAYGTRWYLTLFNLSIPFPAQLRVWDVFMLLGDCPPEPTTTTTLTPSPTTATAPSPAYYTATTTPQPQQPQSDTTTSTLPKGLDILHATSAALIHALRDVLLDSDFENAMKALTAWIPVQDEDLLMKVARAEWRRHQGRARLWEWEWEGWERGRGGRGDKKGGEREEGMAAEDGRDGEGKLKGDGVKEKKGRGIGRLWERAGHEKEKEKGKDKQKEARGTDTA
ncbi:uncharacterized protein B0H64DRAFT_339545 [Chaetomium fimeti]|uniref:Rab-GAP TBC domain-containing protein n=1 Tax=Chaetomium fimeti TaxID=1854472 RepID=A0AAE0HJH7_9PEZI|nr:hypothetical protein B0H64DRAFT_339545 [Chaetomium fimeti]